MFILNTKGAWLWLRRLKWQIRVWHAELAQAQHEHDMSTLPQRVKLLEDKLREKE